MHIRITNKRYDKTPGEYIGRPSVLGNPFVIGQDGDRAEVVNKYRRWLWQEMKEGSSVLKELDRLKTEAQRHELVLICWCKRPKVDVACHGDVIKQAIEWLDRQEGRPSDLALIEPGATPVTINEVPPEQLSMFDIPTLEEKEVPLKENVEHCMGTSEVPVPEPQPIIPESAFESIEFEPMTPKPLQGKKGKDGKTKQLSLLEMG